MSTSYVRLKFQTTIFPEMRRDKVSNPKNCLWGNLVIVINLYFSLAYPPLCFPPLFVL